MAVYRVRKHWSRETRGMDEVPDVARKYDIGDTALSKHIEDDIAKKSCPSLT